MQTAVIEGRHSESMPKLNVQREGLPICKDIIDRQVGQ